MPLREIRSLNNGASLVLWEICETEDALKDSLLLTEEEHRLLQSIKVRDKRMHWLASRNSIRAALRPTGVLQVSWDDSGKPLLLGSDHHLAITHCQNWTGVILSQAAAGIDLEKRSDKVGRIAHKFVREDEWPMLKGPDDLEGLTLIWSMKEALFKYHAIGQLNFKNHLHVVHCDFGKQGVAAADILKEGYKQRLHLHYEQVEPNFYLTFTVGD